MSLESDIQALTLAVNRLTQALQNTSSLPVAAKTSSPAAAPAPVEVAEAPALEARVIPDLPLPATQAEPLERVSKVTQAELREVAQKLLAQKKLPEILRINREHGIKRITECPEEKYDAVYASLTAALGDAP